MDQDQRHRCKFCRKSFPCGRSLGGHMRSHVALMEEGKLNKGSQGFAATNGYGLRENPKKTWRLSDRSSDEKQCRECGKEFQSWKALFGHMRCHSEKRTLSQQEGVEMEEEEEGSWSGGGAYKRKRQPRRPVGSSSSSVSEYEKEQEDVAISLMLLSRDVGYWGNSVSGFTPESSDKYSVILEDRDRDGDESKKMKGYVSDGSSSKKRTGLGTSRFECTTCNKSFRSYQALGGHRANRKRMKGLCFAESDASVDQKGRHRCAICGKVFGSGQALGGHKRSHLVASSIEEDVVVMEDLLDLNLPAPVDEDSSNGKGAMFGSWWGGSNLKSERMVGTMVSNR